MGKSQYFSKKKEIQFSEEHGYSHPDLSAMWYIFAHPRVMSFYWTNFRIWLELLCLVFFIASCELNTACSLPSVLWQTTTVSVAEMTWDGSVLSLAFSCAPVWGQNKVWGKWPFLSLQCYSRMRPILAQTHGHHGPHHMESTMTICLNFWMHHPNHLSAPKIRIIWEFSGKQAQHCWENIAIFKRSGLGDGHAA